MDGWIVEAQYAERKAPGLFLILEPYIVYILSVSESSGGTELPRRGSELLD